MASGITLSAGVRANLLSLQNTAQLMQTTQNRLATGKKVNSALDNPINFFTSQALQSRAGDLNSLLDSMSNGIQTIQAANNGLTSITNTVQSMQSTLNQALQDSTWQSASYSIDSTTIGTGSVKNLSFSGGAVTGTVNIAVNSITTAGTQSTLSTSSSYLAPSVSDPASVESGTFTGLTAGGTYTFKVNGQDITLTSATTGTQSGDTLAHAKTSIQAQLNARFGAGAFTVGNNTAGDGFSISGKLDGTNDVVISNQNGTGGAPVAAAQVGTAYSGLGTGQTYSFDVNDGATTTTINLTAATGGTLANAVTNIQSQLNTAFGAGQFTVTNNGTGFTITGLANGGNDVIISNQTANGAAVQAVYSGAGYTGLAAGETYSFDFNDGTSTTTINLNNTTGGSLGTAVASVQAQLDSAYGAGAFTVTQAGIAIEIAGRADGSNSVIVSNQAAGGGADVFLLGFNTITQTRTGYVAAAAANIGVGTTTQTNLGQTGTSTASLGLGSTTQTSYGTPADPYEFTVNGTAVTVAGGTGLAAAITSINSQLTTANSKFEAFDDSGRLGIREITAQGTQLTLGGTDATSLFGATLTNAGTATGVAAVKTVDQLVAAINADAGLTGKVKASNDNGSLRITNLSLTDLSVVGATSTQVNGGTGAGNTQTISGNTVRKGLVQQFNNLRDQLDKYATDASYNGINLLSGDNLKLTLNETGSSTINIQAKDANGNVLTINSTNLNISAAQNTDFDSNTAINSVLSTLTTSLATLRSQGSAFGSNLSTVQNRQDFTKAMINTLQTGADNLVLADTNEEGANLLALQTRQSLSTTALSLSAQADQAVLSLFG